MHIQFPIIFLALAGIDKMGIMNLLILLGACIVVVVHGAVVPLLVVPKSPGIGNLTLAEEGLVCVPLCCKH